MQGRYASGRNRRDDVPLRLAHPDEEAAGEQASLLHGLSAPARSLGGPVAALLPLLDARLEATVSTARATAKGTLLHASGPDCRLFCGKGLDTATLLVELVLEENEHKGRKRKKAKV